MMRWINAFTLFISGLFVAVAGYAKLGEARFAGTALVAGIGLIIWSGGTVWYGEVTPHRRLPRLVAQGWAWVFWYGVLAIVALKYSSTVAQALAPGEVGKQGGELELALLPYFLAHTVLVGLCPFGYVWSQFYPGRPR